MCFARWTSYRNSSRRSPKWVLQHRYRGAILVCYTFLFSATQSCASTQISGGLYLCATLFSFLLHNVASTLFNTFHFSATQYCTLLVCSATNCFALSQIFLEQCFSATYYFAQSQTVLLCRYIGSRPSVLMPLVASANLAAISAHKNPNKKTISNCSHITRQLCTTNINSTSV